MPELPEVESVRRGLVRARMRASVIAIWRSDMPLRMGSAWRQENLSCLLGATPGRIARRGKYLIWKFDGRDGDPLALVLHLGMTGRCGIARAGANMAEHTHISITFADARELRFVDPRRFGGVRAGALEQLLSCPPLSELGPEPFDRRFDGQVLAARAQASTRALRDVLLDQSVVAGIGNIYALEALFLARLNPLVPAHRLGPSAWHRLAWAIKRVLGRGIRNGGTTLRDFRNVTGEIGRNQDDLRVYGRAGKPCPRCRRPLRSFVQGTRGGVYCPFDQPRTRLR